MSQHSARCAIKYWTRVQRYANLNDCTWAQSKSPLGPPNPVRDYAVPFQGEGVTGQQDKGCTLRIVHEHTFDVRLAGDALSQSLLYFEETEDVESYKAALVTVLLLGIPIIDPSKRPSKRCNRFNILNNLAVSINELIRGDIEINDINADGETILDEVCFAGVANLLEPLFWRGAVFDDIPSDDNTPLLLAIQSGDLDTVRFALALGSDPNLLWPLRDAWVAGRQDMMTLLVDCGADINYTDDCSYSLLLFAIEDRSLEDVRFMLSLGADPNHSDPLAVSIDLCERSKCDGCIHELMAVALVEQGADLAMNPDFTVLHSAALQAHVRLLRAVLHRSTSSEILDIKDFQGDTALHIAVKTTRSISLQHSLRVVAALLDAGANIEALDEEKNTPLCIAASGGFEALVHMLLIGGADINVRGVDGYSALTLAAGGGHQELVQSLLDAGAMVKTTDFDEPSALSRAAITGHRAIVRYLLKEAPPTHGDRLYVLRALEDAIKGRHEDIV